MKGLQLRGNFLIMLIFKKLFQGLFDERVNSIKKLDLKARMFSEIKKKRPQNFGFRLKACGTYT